MKLNRIKLEYGGMKKLLTEKEERLTPEEKNIKVNFIKQQEWFVGKGFFGQGQALVLSNEKESALTWVEKAEEFFETQKNPVLKCIS